MNSLSTICKFQAQIWWRQNVHGNFRCKSKNMINTQSMLRILTNIWKSFILNNAKELMWMKIYWWNVWLKLNGKDILMPLKLMMLIKLKELTMNIAIIPLILRILQLINLSVKFWPEIRNIIKVNVFINNLYKLDLEQQIIIFILWHISTNVPSKISKLLMIKFSNVINGDKNTFLEKDVLPNMKLTTSWDSYQTTVAT